MVFRSDTHLFSQTLPENDLHPDSFHNTRKLLGLEILKFKVPPSHLCREALCKTKGYETLFGIDHQ